MGPDDAAPPRHPEGGRRQRGVVAVVDLELEEATEKRLVRRRQEERVPELGQLVRLLQQGQRLLPGLAEVEAGVEHDAILGDACRYGALDPVEEEATDLLYDVVVVRLRVGQARGKADVRRH